MAVVDTNDHDFAYAHHKYPLFNTSGVSETDLMSSIMFYLSLRRIFDVVHVRDKRVVCLRDKRVVSCT